MSSLKEFVSELMAGELEFAIKMSREYCVAKANAEGISVHNATSLFAVEYPEFVTWCKTEIDKLGGFHSEAFRGFLRSHMDEDYNITQHNKVLTQYAELATKYGLYAPKKVGFGYDS